MEKYQVTDGPVFIEDHSRLELGPLLDHYNREWHGFTFINGILFWDRVSTGLNPNDLRNMAQKWQHHHFLRLEIDRRRRWQRHCQRELERLKGEVLSLRRQLPAPEQRCLPL